MFAAIISRLSIAWRIVFIAALVAPVAFPVTVYGASTSDQKSAAQDTVYFELGDFGATCGVADQGAGTDTVDNFLKALADQESGGNPKAQSATSSASGKYQYIDSTWKSRKAIYPPSGDYARAKDAPEPVQDAVAYIEYSKKFADLDNNIFKLAVSHFLPAALSNPALLDKVPPGNSITPREYGESMVRKVREGVGSGIPLRYSEAPDIQKYLATSESPAPDAGAAASCADSQDIALNQGITDTVLAYAWRTYQSGQTTKKPAYIKAINRAKSKGQYTGDTCYGGGVDCGAFVTRLLIDSGFDPDYNYAGKGGNTDIQLKWAREHWKRLGRGNEIDVASLRPGDVAFQVYNETNAHHTFVFVGDVPGFNSTIASASQCQRAPMAGAESKTGADIVWYRRVD